MAQPWAVIGGYLVCASVGVIASKTGLPVPIAAGLAIGLGVFVMMATRCLHPPAGIVALFPLMSGDDIASISVHQVLAPVLADSVVLVVAALVIINWLGKRHYPRLVTEPSQGSTELSSEDFRAAILEHMHPRVVSEDELEELVALARHHAEARHKIEAGALGQANRGTNDVVE